MTSSICGYKLSLCTNKNKNILLRILGSQGANKNTYKDRNSKLIET